MDDQRKNRLVKRVIEKTEEYLSVPSVVTFEKPFVEYLENDFKKLGCDVEQYDTMVGLSKGESRYFFSAHIDRHGLVSEGDGTFHYAADVVRQSHTNKPWEERKAELEKVFERFIGTEVQAYEPDNGDILGQGKISDTYFCEIRQNLVMHVDELKDIPAYTPAGYVHAKHETEGEEFEGQIDNVISAASVYVLYEEGYQGRATLTPREEVGDSWRYLRSYLDKYNLTKNLVFVLDTSPFPEDICAKSGQVVLRNRDGYADFSSLLMNQMMAMSKMHNIPYLLKDKYIEEQNVEREKSGQEPLGMGHTELGKLIEETGGVCNGTTVQLPTYNYHAENETTTRTAIGNYIGLLVSMMEMEKAHEGNF